MLVHNHINLGSGFTWNRDHLIAVLSDEEAREDHIDALITEALARGFDGIEIDYENLDGDAGDDDVLVTFMSELYPAAQAAGLRVEMDPPNRTSDAGPWAHHRAFDYERLHPYVDCFRIMTYEFSGSWSGPGPIAPHAWVEQGIQYALSKGVPKEKIAIGLHFWAVDWNLDTNTTSSLVWEDVEALITEHSPTIQWHSSHKENWFTYTDGNGDDHEIWYASVDSVAARCELANQYDIAGVYGWRQGGEDPDFYPAIQTAFIEAEPLEENMQHIGFTSHAVFGTTTTLNVPSGTQENDLLIMVLSSNFDEVAPTVDAGWTLEHQRLLGVDGHTLRVYSRFATDSEPASYSATWSATQWHHGALHTWRNAVLSETTAPASSTSTGTGTVDFPGVSVADGNVVFLAGSTVANGTRTIDDPEPDAIYADANRGVITASDPQTSSGTSPSYTLTIDTGSSSLGMIAAVLVLEPPPDFVPVGRSLQADWDVHSETGRSLSSEWDVRALAGRSAQSSWLVRALVGRDAESSWSIYVLVSRDAVLAWDKQMASTPLVFGIVTLTELPSLTTVTKIPDLLTTTDLLEGS
jgi:hypothetical protein